MPEIKDFVVEAVETWGGQRDPDDPLFNSLEVRTIQVQRIGETSE